jgi:uncharacterized protein (DUF362 family)/NAD-dependent dihydropyrimidine dehydrogenase PreA subunit
LGTLLSFSSPPDIRIVYIKREFLLSFLFMALVIVKETSYEYDRLRQDVFEMLGRLDNGLIQNASKVLLKPNLLAASTEEQAITTHPLVIKAAVEYVMAKGGRPTVSDSPPMGSFERIIRKCGLNDALSDMPVEIAEFRSSRKVSLDGRWKHIELAGEALDADVIINMPKLKTHVQMVMTLAVKNLFGCIIGMKKPEWHYRIGENREIFSELLVTVYKTLRPSINIMDGILAMEGAGPGAGGTPKHLGLLMGSDNAVSMDAAVCGLIGLDPHSLPTIKTSIDMGLYKEFDTVGELKPVRDFKVPDLREMLLGPSYARGFIKKQLIDRPVCVGETCKLCKECQDICPAGAISVKDKGMAVDYDTCIKCYCCLEICPHGAMEIHETLTKKFLKITSPLFRWLR